MSLIRRWFDPIRSRWFYQKPSRQAVLSTQQGLSIYVRLDDVYSYLAVQQLVQLNEILSFTPSRRSAEWHVGRRLATVLLK